MDNFTFVDRPDNQRLKLMKDVYSELNSDIVKLFIDFQWTYRNMQSQYDYALDKSDLSESRFISIIFIKRFKSFFKHRKYQNIIPDIVISH